MPLRSESHNSPVDIASLLDDLLNKLNTTWMGLTYPFAGFGREVGIERSCDIRRAASNRIKIGNSVYIARDTWLNIPEFIAGAPPAIILGNGCKIGRRCMISAKNRVWLDEDVMLGPSVLITDHSHQFANPDMPIHAQGLTAGGYVHVERNCWLGHGAAIIATSGDVVIGRNCVIGANCVVTCSLPSFSVVVGSPARIVRRYDPAAGKWTPVQIAAGSPPVRS